MVLDNQKHLYYKGVFLYRMDNKNLNELIKKTKPLKLNIGSGLTKLPEFISIDKIKEVRPDIVADVEKGLPMFKDGSVDYILVDGVMEHIKDLVFVMEEFYRICKQNATIEIVVPYFASTGAFQDPTHTRFFTEHTFDYFQRGKQRRSCYAFKCDYEVVNVKYDYLPLFRFLPFRRRLGHIFLNIITRMHVKLKVIKPARKMFLKHTNKSWKDIHN